MPEIRFGVFLANISFDIIEIPRDEFEIRLSKLKIEYSKLK